MWAKAYRDLKQGDELANGDGGLGQDKGLSEYAKEAPGLGALKVKFPELGDRLN